MIHSKYYCSGCDDSWIEHEKAEDPGLCPNCYSSEKAQEVEFREAKEWIRVEKEKPKSHENVLLFLEDTREHGDGKYVSFGFYVQEYDSWCFFDSFTGEFLSNEWVKRTKVCFWRHLPEPPEGDA